MSPLFRQREVETYCLALVAAWEGAHLQWVPPPSEGEGVGEAPRQMRPAKRQTII